MANITENSTWESGIYQLETDDPVLGGAPAFDAGIPVTGHANAQAQQLANRTKWLYDNKASTNDLADSSNLAKGASLVGFVSPLASAVGRSLAKKVSDTVSVKDFGATGDGNAVADTAAFQAACSVDASKVIIPTGIYRLNQTIDVHSYTSLIGDGRQQVTIICEHNGPVFNYIAGDNAPLNVYQGGDNTVSGFTLKRDSMPSVKIDGNYGIKMPATFGITRVEDIDFINLGDTCVHYEDIAPTSVGSGPIFLSRLSFTALWGWCVEFKSLFAQVYLDGLTSVRCGAGILFDGSTATSSFRGFNVSVRNTNIESVGLGPGGVLRSDPQPALSVKKLHCLLLENNYLSVHSNNPNPVVLLDDVTTVDISASNAMVASGTADSGCIKLTGSCNRVDIGRSTLLEGVNTAAYAISSDGTTRLSIRDPRITGFLGDQLKLTGVGSTLPVLVESQTGVTLLNQNYSGSLAAVGSTDDTSPRLADPRGVADYSALYSVTGGTASVLTRFGATITRDSLGVYSVTFDVTRANSRYIPEISVQSTTPLIYTYSSATTSGFVIRVFDLAGSPADPSRIGFTIHVG